MRQSEGNKTAKRLSATFRVQDRTGSTCVQAKEGPATAAVGWLARVLSSLLLKTASVLPVV